MPHVTLKLSQIGHEMVDNDKVYTLDLASELNIKVVEH
jgi:hypothetical protein